MLDPSAQDPTVSADIAQSQYAQRTRELIKLITDLRALGADAFFDLPRIAVIGNQSAGKSSLVEAISGITVPRAHGTCTRCPMECRITRTERDQPWQCQIRLRRETSDADGNTITAREEPFGPPILDKSVLEETLRRAQLAILNPSVQAEFFVNYDTSNLEPGQTPPGSNQQLQFSENVVCLDLSGPDLTDLSFIDLPGIISNVAPGEDRGNIIAVKNMVEKHIQGNTLILLTITMRDDIDCQGAADLAHQADEDGIRTIGVLTKPDTIQYGEEQAWLRILGGSAHPLRHGYYITKQPTPQELKTKISFAAARRNEQDFFRTTWPWCDKPELRERMGTPRLTKALSKLLGGVINQAVPTLRRDVQKSLASVRDEIAALPLPPPANPASALLALVTGFVADVSALIDGAKDHENLLQLCRPAHKQLRYNIRATAPTFVPFTANEDRGGFTSVVFEPETECGEPQEMEETCLTEVMEETCSTEVMEETCLSEVMDLDDVRDHIQRSLTRELPFNVPYAAKVSLIERFVARWDTHITSCFNAVHAAALSELHALVGAHFDLGATGSATALRIHVDGLVKDVIEQYRAETVSRIEWVLKLEDPPFTLNDQYYAGYRMKYLMRYKDARKGFDVRGIPQYANVNQALAALADSGFRGLNRVDLGRLYIADSHDEELTVMAETAAYFHVAYKRIIDNIPRIIDQDFLRAIQAKIQSALVTGLGLGEDNASDRARAYLAEDETVTARRAQLKQKQERLEEIQARLYQFGL